MRTVRDVMATEVFSVTEDTEFRGIVETLVERGVSALPVVDGEGHLAGIVTEGDLLHKEEFGRVGTHRRCARGCGLGWVREEAPTTRRGPATRRG